MRTHTGDIPGIYPGQIQYDISSIPMRTHTDEIPCIYPGENKCRWIYSCGCIQVRTHTGDIPYIHPGQIQYDISSIPVSNRELAISDQRLKAEGWLRMRKVDDVEYREVGVSDQRLVRGLHSLTFDFLHWPFVYICHLTLIFDFYLTPDPWNVITVG